VVGPSIENAIETQDGVELIVVRNTIEPEGGFVGVEGSLVMTTVLMPAISRTRGNMRLESLCSEKVSGFRECAVISGETKRVKDSDDAASGFRDGRVFDEECAPDGFGLLGLGEGPIVLGSHAGGTEEFGLGGSGR